MKIKDRVKPKLPPIDPGVYIAVCIGVIDLGEQYSDLYKSYSNKVKFVWAIPGEQIEIEGKMEERQLSREFSIAQKSTSKLRTFLSSWNGRTYTDDEYADLELFDQLGKACQLNVVLSASGEYANVDGIMPLPKGMPAPSSRTDMMVWDMDAWDDEAFQKLPSWTQDQIKKSTQYQKYHAPETEIDVKPPEKAESAEEECPI